MLLVLCKITVLLNILQCAIAWTPSSPATTKKNQATSTESGQCMTRREWATAAAAIAGTATTLMAPDPATAAGVSSNGLASRLAKRDASVLVNPIFNIPPTAQVYPEFLRGTWDISCKFGGFLFPSTKIPKQDITSNPLIPGFQKCSIASICDVGKDFNYQMKIDTNTGLEDRIFTLTNQISSSLEYNAVSEIIYNGNVNPNRISIDFVEYRTRNAERIELFCNARESEYVTETDVFVCSEAIRQVTFGTGSTPNVPRQVVGNYAHFWTWRKSKENPDTSITGNLLTAAYLDPQDPLFFQEPSRPVAVYSHVLTGTRSK